MNPSAREQDTAAKGPSQINGFPLVLLLMVLAGIYILAAKVGLALAVVHPSATAVWAPTGIAIAANLIFGYRVWPAFLMGAFVANVTTAGSIETSLAIATGNALEGFVGAWLVNRFAGGSPALQIPAGIIKFSVLAAGLAPVVSATVGVTSLTSAGFASWSDYPSVWLTWWLGDATGALIVAPFLLLWSQRPVIHWNRPRIFEAACLCFTLVLICQLLFNTFQPAAVQHYPMQFVVLPFLAWTAFRLGPASTSAATVLLSTLAVWGTWRGLGPFAVTDQNAALLLLQSFTAVLSMTFLALAAAVQQRNMLLFAEREARAAAEAALSARDQFLAVASHELNTPVAALMGSAQLLRRRREGGETRWERFDSMLMVIEETARRLGHLVKDLLDVSRVRTGRLELSPAELDLVPLVQRAVDRARELHGRAHRFSATLEADCCLLAGDAERLEQVLTNVLENAVKYSPTGGEIAVQLDSASDDGVLLTVRDQGIGLPAGAAESIFEPFGRAPNAAAGHIPGMGLGLYVCRTIVEGHGGHIWAESPGPGQGTSLLLWLPRRPAEVPSAPHG